MSLMSLVHCSTDHDFLLHLQFGGWLDFLPKSSYIIHNIVAQPFRDRFIFQIYSLSKFNTYIPQFGRQDGFGEFLLSMCVISREEFSFKDHPRRNTEHHKNSQEKTCL